MSNYLKAKELIGTYDYTGSARQAGYAKDLLMKIINEKQEMIDTYSSMLEHGKFQKIERAERQIQTWEENIKTVINDIEGKKKINSKNVINQYKAK